MNATLAEIPHPHWGKEGANTEYLFHATVWLTLRLVGVYIKAEVSTAKGRADAVVETATHRYAVEFKLDRSLAEALRQIEVRGYLRPYADDARTRAAIGVKFSSETRQMRWAVG